MAQERPAANRSANHAETGSTAFPSAVDDLIGLPGIRGLDQAANLRHDDGRQISHRFLLAGHGRGVYQEGPQHRWMP